MTWIRGGELGSPSETPHVVTMSSGLGLRGRSSSLTPVSFVGRGRQAYRPLRDRRGEGRGEAYVGGGKSRRKSAVAHDTPGKRRSVDRERRVALAPGDPPQGVVGALQDRDEGSHGSQDGKGRSRARNDRGKDDDSRDSAGPHWARVSSRAESLGRGPVPVLFGPGPGGGAEGRSEISSGRRRAGPQDPVRPSGTFGGRGRDLRTPEPIRSARGGPTPFPFRPRRVPSPGRRGRGGVGGEKGRGRGEERRDRRGEG